MWPFDVMLGQDLEQRSQRPQSPYKRLDHASRSGWGDAAETSFPENEGKMKVCVCTGTYAHVGTYMWKPEVCV